MPEVLYLTNREKEIVHLISREFTYAEIAMYLNIVVGTVEVHRKNIFKKTGARNMAGLMRWGFENGVLEMGCWRWGEGILIPLRFIISNSKVKRIKDECH